MCGVEFRNHISVGIGYGRDEYRRGTHTFVGIGRISPDHLLYRNLARAEAERHNRVDMVRYTEIMHVANKGRG